jgi:hypothetical protein
VILTEEPHSLKFLRQAFFPRTNAIPSAQMAREIYIKARKIRGTPIIAS